MASVDNTSVAAAEFRRHFDQYYLAVIPRLLNEEGKFLSFVAMLTAIEALAGASAPDDGSGERFRKFVSCYFPEIYSSLTSDLWAFRNRMIHSFNPSPFLIICHNSRMHLQLADDVVMLNAEDFYSDTLTAARGYFKDLYSVAALQERFSRRIAEAEGGRMQTGKIFENVHTS